MPYLPYTATQGPNFPAAPDAFADCSRGFGAGYQWTDTTTGLEYTCVTNDLGNASWLLRQMRSRHPNTVVVLGDSRVAQVHADLTSKLNKSGYNFFNVGNAMAGNRAIIVKNLGVSAERSDQILARLPAAIATGARVLFIRCGVNDIAQNYPTAGTSGATAWANIKLMIDSGIAAGMLPLVVLDAGSTTLSTAQIAQLFILNQSIREYAEQAPMVAFDPAPWFWNSTSTSAAAITMVGMADTTHEGNTSAWNAALAFSTVLQSIMPARPHGVRGSIESPSISLVNLLSNPMFATSSGGTLNTGITGTVAGSWAGSRSGSASGVFSVAASADGYNEQVMACTFTAAGEEVRVQQDVSIANWSFGDIVQGSSEIVVDAGSSNLAGAYLYVQVAGVSGTVSSTTMDLFPLPSGGAVAPVAYKLNCLTEKMTIPTYASKSWLTVRVIAQAAGAGSATVRVRRTQLRKRLS